MDECRISILEEAWELGNSNSETVHESCCASSKYVVPLNSFSDLSLKYGLKNNHSFIGLYSGYLYENHISHDTGLKVIKPFAWGMLKLPGLGGQE